MAASSGLPLEFRNGAQQLKLPDEMKTLFSDMQEAAKRACPTMRKDGGRIMFQYNEIPECESFSKQFLPKKVENPVSKIKSLADRN
uniref:Uncharacterized protein n=1 Tax=Gibberella zeae TaxID=5518 RepID=A0A4E9EH83_GIBZA